VTVRPLCHRRLRARRPWTFTVGWEPHCLGVLASITWRLMAGQLPPAGCGGMTEHRPWTGAREGGGEVGLGWAGSVADGVDALIHLMGVTLTHPLSDGALRSCTPPQLSSADFAPTSPQRGLPHEPCC
jgi:hypothetical protein